MKIKRSSFRLAFPVCPFCKSKFVYIEKKITNYIKIILDTVISFLFYPPFSYELRCKHCGKKFSCKIDES